MRKLLALLLFMQSWTFAQSRFDGTWQMKMDTLEFSGPTEDYLFVDGMYHCKSCIPKVDVKTDGVDYPVVGYNYDTLAVQIIDDRAIKFTMKKAGKPYFECIETVSPDGQKMMEDFTNKMEAATVTGKAGFTRLGNGPAGSHALSGQWRMDTVKNATRVGTLQIFQTTAGLMKISDGSASYEVRLDGKDHADPGDIHSTRSMKVVDEYTLEETYKTDGYGIDFNYRPVTKLVCRLINRRPIMARPKKVRSITSAEVLEFIEGSTLEILEIVSRVIDRKIMQLKETK